MSWIEKYREATFRNVAFFVDQHETSGGFKKSVIEIPDSDSVVVQNMGQKAKTASFDAYVLGDDYFDLRDALMVAFDTSGSGSLVHPYLGTMEVEILDYSLRETISENRVARFSVTYVRVSDITPATLIPIVNTAAEVVAKRDLVNKSLLAKFLDAYSLIRSPFAAVARAQQAIAAGFAAIRTGKRLYAANAELQYQLTKSIRDVGTLAVDAGNLANSALSALTFGTITVDNGYDPDVVGDNMRAQYEGMRAVWGFKPEKTVRAELDPATEFAALVARAAVACSAGMLSEITYESFDEAETIRTQLFAQIDAILLDPTTTDEVYESFYALRAAVQRDMDARAGSQARTMTVISPNSIPALVLSYDLYGSIDHEVDIIARNGIEHPGFVAGNQEVKVIINA